MLLFWTLACAPFPRGPAVDVPETLPATLADDVEADWAAAVAARIEPVLDADPVPGLSVGLVRSGQVVYAGGFGWADIEAERPMTPDTPILLSSVSKVFVGVVAMQAVEAGTVELDDPVDVSFPLDNPRVEGDRITLRHLLTHHSGIEDSRAYAAAYVEGDPTTDLGDFLEGYLVEGGEHWRAGNYAGRQPGEAFAYSNVGLALAGHALAADGETFAQTLRRQVLDPLNMDDSAYFLAELRQPPAVPYARARGGRVRPWPQYGFPTYPDGLLRSTASDLARFVAAVAGDGALDEVRVLDASTVQSMLTVDPELGTDEDGQAIAWAMRRLGDRPLRGHNGGDFGSLAELWLDPDSGHGFAIVANGFPSSFQTWLDLEEALFRLLEEGP